MITPPTGATSSAASSAGLAEPGGELEHALPGLRRDASSIQCETGAAKRADQLLAAHPAGGGLFPALRGWLRGMRWRRSSSRRSHRSSRRSSLPERVRGSGCARSIERAWAPCTARARARSGRAAASARALRPSRAHDDRRDRLAPALVGQAETAASSTSGWRLEHGLDLGRRDVLAAADDRVGLAAADAQPPALVERAEVAACAASRRRASAPGATVGPAIRISPSSAIRTRVQNSGGPALVVALALDARRRPARGDLRAALGEAVGEAHRHAGGARALRRSAAGTGPPPVSAQRSAGGSSRPASSSRASVVATRLTSVTSCSRSACSTRSVSKRSCTTAVVA